MATTRNTNRVAPAAPAAVGARRLEIGLFRFHAEGGWVHFQCTAAQVGDVYKVRGHLGRGKVKVDDVCDCSDAALRRRITRAAVEAAKQAWYELLVSSSTPPPAPEEVAKWVAK